MQSRIRRLAAGAAGGLYGGQGGIALRQRGLKPLKCSSAGSCTGIYQQMNGSSHNVFCTAGKGKIFPG